MAPQIPSCPPDEVRIGTSWYWNVAYPDFPAGDSWQLNLYFRGPTDLDIAWASGISADGDQFAVRITPALAAGLTTAGAYRMLGTVTLSGEVYEVENRHVLVHASSTTAVGAKSFNRQMLEAIETALVAGISDSAEVKRIEINSRVVEYRDRAELERLAGQYRMLVAIEDNPDGRISHEVMFVG